MNGYGRNLGINCRGVFNGVQRVCLNDPQHSVVASDDSESGLIFRQQNVVNVAVGNR